MGSPLTAERLAAENATHDRLLALFALVAVGLVAAYPVGPGNPDARLYLATGRLIVHGQYRYGSDPFAYGEHAAQGWVGLQRFLSTLGLGPKQLDWVNTGWLAEVVFYLCYAGCGGAGLVALRVVLVGATIAALRWLSWRLAELQSRPATPGRSAQLSTLLPPVSLGQASAFASWWTVGSVLTGLVLSVRMHIRPESVGLMCLVGELVILAAPAMSGSPQAATSPTPSKYRFLADWLNRTPNRRWLLLPPLFLLWANSDATVILGLTALVLYWFGQHLQAMWGPDRFSRDVLTHEQRRFLGRIILACAVAAVFNPFHLHVFDPSPLGFSASAELLQSRNLQAARLGVSPFTAAYFTDAHGRWVGLSPAEWAYYGLLVFAALGLWLGRDHWRWSWFLLALFGLVLSCYLARYTAWFAILATPGALAGWRHYLVRQFGDKPKTTRRAVLVGQLGRFALAVGLLGMIVGTLWPRPTTGTAAGLCTGRGWGFSLVEDASIKRAAKLAATWRDQSRLPGRALHFAWLNAAGYWAWAHAPEPAVWIDLRAGLFTPQSVRDFLDAVEALEKTGTPEGQRERRRWQDLFRKYDVSYVVLHNDNVVSRVDGRGNRVQLLLLPLLLADRDEQGQPVWQMLDYIDGETFFLAWTGSRHWEALRRLVFSPSQRWQQGAGPEEGREEFDSKPSAVGRDLKPWRTLRVYFTGQPSAVPLAATAARWAVENFNIWRDSRYLQARQGAEAQMVWATLIGSTASLQVGGMASTAAQLGTIVIEGWPNVPRVPPFAWERDALVWLAWRWARRGILEAPDHPYTWAICYDVANLLDLYESQFSEGVQHQSRLLARMFLLRQLARLQPGLANLHLELASRFLERGCDDLALVHAENFIQLPVTSPRDSQSDTPEKRLQNYLGLSLEQLRNRVNESRQRFQTWLSAQTQPGWISARPSEVLARAREMWQSRLAGAALSLLQQFPRTLSPQQPEFAEAVRLFCDIYVQTGDAVSLQRLLQQSWTESILGRQRYELLQALAAGALGDARQEASRRAQLETSLQRQAAELFLRGSVPLILGSDLGPAGSGFYGFLQQHQALMRSRERIYNLLATASAALEIGDMSLARTALERVRILAPRDPLAALAEHYLRLLPPPPPDKQ